MQLVCFSFTKNLYVKLVKILYETTRKPNLKIIILFTCINRELCLKSNYNYHDKWRYKLPYAILLKKTRGQRTTSTITLTACLPSSVLQVYKGGTGSCLRNGWYIIGRCLHFDNIAGHKNADSFKAAPGIARCASGGSACRAFPPTSPFALARALSSLLPILRCSNLHPPRPPFSVPAQTTTPIAPPSVVLLPATLALSTGLLVLQHPPRLGPAALLRIPQTSTRHLVTLFSSAPTATGLILRPLSRLQPPLLPLCPCSLSLLSLRCLQTAPNISHDPLSSSRSFLRDFSFPPRPLKRRLTVAYNCDSWYNLY